MYVTRDLANNQDLHPTQSLLVDNFNNPQNPNANFGQPAPYPPPPQKSNFLRNLFLGCGCVMVFGICIIGIGVWYAFSQASNLIAYALTETIKQSELPPDQKQRLVDRINKLNDDYKSGKVSLEKMGKIVEAMAESPIIPAGSAYVADEKYIKPSGLSDDEKATGRQSVQRLVRGVIEKKIPQSELEEIMGPISEKQGNETKLKDKVTDEELREFLESAKERADEAMIPDEPFVVNFADEFDKAIDKAMESK